MAELRNIVQEKYRGKGASRWGFVPRIGNSYFEVFFCGRCNTGAIEIYRAEVDKECLLNEIKSDHSRPTAIGTYWYDNRPIVNCPECGYADAATRTRMYIDALNGHIAHLFARDRWCTRNAQLDCRLSANMSNDGVLALYIGVWRTALFEQSAREGRLL